MSERVLDLTTALAGLSSKSRRLYRRWIQRFLGATYRLPPERFHLTHIRADILTTALQPPHLRAWLDSLRERSGATVVQARSAILWLAQRLMEEERLPLEAVGALHVIKPPQQPQPSTRRTWLSAEEARRLLEALGKRDDKPSTRARDTALIVLLITCGLRREEAAQARWRDYYSHDEHAELLVHGKGGKPRTIRLPSLTVEALKVWRGYHPMPYGDHFIFTQITRSGMVTTAGLSGQAILAIVKAAGEAAELAIRPHDLRRTFAQHALEVGISLEALQGILGHAHAGITQQYLKDLKQGSTGALPLQAPQGDKSP
ncbi:MAG: hypothetical protein DYG88_07315 [Chloroflexi bacterium CFX4]|nr:hypothetical protein [Chloroflexi bacterium CFX4]MDL1921978.1 hypothetical protein [Chloroflexi bacterium CFX3]